MSEDKKTYNLKEVREKFFPNFAECDKCGGFHPKNELIRCFNCHKSFCEHCFRRHDGHFCQAGNLTPLAVDEAVCSCKVFIPSTESTALKCANCGKPPRH